MAMIALTLPKGEIPVTGKQVTFKAPCDSSAVTGVILDSTKYAFLDSVGSTNTSKAFVKGNLVSVLLDVERQEVYVQNSAPSSGSSSASLVVTIGTNWVEDATTGVHTQLVSVEGLTGDENETVIVDPVNTHGTTTTEQFAAYVEEHNQYLDYITNGDAKTVRGGILFHIFGDPSTINIPIKVVIV